MREVVNEVTECRDFLLEMRTSPSSGSRKKNADSKFVTDHCTCDKRGIDQRRRAQVYATRIEE